VAALLIQHANTKTWAAEGKNAMTQRAVLINGASKNVYDRNNNRWDAALPRPAAQPLDNDTGAGLLDARRSYEVFKDGPTPATVRYDSNGFAVNGIGPKPTQGWATGTIFSNTETGESKWIPDANLRKGSYLTATLAWERQTNGANAASATYSRTLGDLGLNIRKNSDDSLVASSDTSNNSVEHVVAKLPERGRYQVAVRKFNNPSEDFAVAWHSYAAPTTLREFNGDFMGDRGALNNNGWYDMSGHGASAVTRSPFGDITMDSSFAMNLTPNSLGLQVAMAQEVITPTAGLLLQFDLGFQTNITSAMFGITLGGVDLLAAAGYAGGSITPDANNTGNYFRYTIDLANSQNIFSGLSGGFQDLRFSANGYGGGSIYVDNIYLIPTPGGVAILCMSGVFTARRRRV
jgi:hypothetical protein